MQISLFAPLSNPHHDADYIAALGRGAEERGFHSIWLGEHVVLFDEYTAQYPYAEDGRIPMGGEHGMLEPFTALSFMAAHTKTLRLGTGICLVPQRNPVYTAKEVAAVDYLSGGRVDFGIGVGWLAEEFAALGVPFEKRGARCAEYLEVMKRLWCDEVSSFSGEFYDLPACRQYPKPVQKPMPPIFVGGESNPALARVADIGQGWYGFNLTVETFKERLVKLDELLAAKGRKRDELQIVASAHRHKINKDLAAQFQDAGATQLVVMILGRDIDELERRLDGYAEDYL